MKVIEIKQNDFNKLINVDKKILVDCYATWCGPCRMLSPIIDEVSEEIDDVIFYKLNVDEADMISREYGIMSIPTLLVFENGKLIKREVGFMDKDEVKELLK